MICVPENSINWPLIFIKLGTLTTLWLPTEALVVLTVTDETRCAFRLHSFPLNSRVNALNDGLA